MTYRFVPNFALRIVQQALLVEAIVRGFNYMSTPDASSALYTELEQSAPLGVWGALFITCGVVGLFGEAWLSYNGSSLQWSHRAWPTFIAHVGLLALFLAFAVSSLLGVLSREPIYGYVTPYDFAFFALGHWAYARRRKHV
ncbi:minor tail protein [Mycobacterium phage MarkPhew]|uniref:Membrane protein n=1 Tax=Mycobacterium phage MarkPhew TaxID=2725625 RepID=A0A6M3SWH0_9CAUD|nr:minor tail protein [Mycobacterium phage MarkPhew]QJD50333.1 membrane protein [Mycobacterium phage MarkPhew]